MDHIVSHKENKGLARAFATGIDKSLKSGADIIVNTDADNQYCAEDIPKLINPIIKKKADVVVGNRQFAHCNWLKKLLLKLGSSLIRRLTNAEVYDVASGFRAYSREAALRINVFSDFSYTIENIFQLGFQKMKIVSIPIRTNKTKRKSRLITSIPVYILKQVIILIRVYATYKALKVFSLIGIILLLPGIFGFIRFLYFYFLGEGAGHIQSLIFSAVFLLSGILVIIVGVLADVISNNRKLLENLLYKIKKIELERLEDHHNKS